jgi:hypothetical protein
MQRHELTRQIERDTIVLHRRRLICALIRREGILADNPHLVLSLADSLLDTLAYNERP